MSQCHSHVIPTSYCVVRCRKAFAQKGTSEKALRRLVKTLLEPEAVSVKYEVRDAIGSGGFGVVLEVRDLATNELLAMKKLPFDVDGNDNANIKREIFNIIQLAF